MLTLLWLLLPVAAASGWFAAKRSQTNAISTNHTLSPKYYQGLNYLIDDQPDKAIQVFCQLIETNDKQALELHLALGNLFRQRGEVDRAIHVHQNLVDNAHISEEIKSLATVELAHDFLRAGLLDRAEGLLLQLWVEKADNGLILKLLQTIYQQEKEWRKAIDVVIKNGDVDIEQKSVLAQYFCELAEEATTGRNPQAVIALLDQALSYDASCVRANIIKGRVFNQSADYAKALASYKDIAQQNPVYLGEVVNGMLESTYQLGKVTELTQFLRHHIKNHFDINCVEVFIGLLKETKSEEQASIYLISFLKDAPSLPLMLMFFQLNAKHMQGELKDVCRLASESLVEIMKNKSVYLCEGCGFSGKTLHWLCPSCKEWGSTVPINYSNRKALDNQINH